MSISNPTAVKSFELLSLTIRTLTERFPGTMPLLAAQGLDLCCGGGHTLGEAIDLHKIDSGTFVPLLLSVISTGDIGG